MKIAIVETAMNGVYHSEINSCMYEIFSRIGQDSDVEIHCGKEHAESIKRINPDAKIRSYKFFPLPKLSNLILRDILGFFIAIRLLVRGKYDQYIFTYTLPVTHWGVWLANSVLHRNVMIMLHGQAEAYVKNSTLRLTKYYFGLSKILFRTYNRIQYIILGKPILNDIRHIFSKSSKYIIIDHPYSFNTPVNRIEPAFPFIFGQIGVGNIGKGTQILFELADRMSDLVKSNKIQFKLIGKLDSSLKSLDNGLVEFFETPLSEKEFKTKINSLTYALLLRDENYGRGVASGSFLDAVKYEIPFVSLNNKFVEYYSSKVGIQSNVVRNIDEMELLIRKKIADFSSIKYNSEREKIKSLQTIFSVDTIIQSVRQQMI